MNNFLECPRLDQVTEKFGKNNKTIEVFARKKQTIADLHGRKKRKSIKLLFSFDWFWINIPPNERKSTQGEAIDTKAPSMLSSWRPVERRFYRLPLACRTRDSLMGWVNVCSRHFLHLYASRAIIRCSFHDKKKAFWVSAWLPTGGIVVPTLWWWWWWPRISILRYNTHDWLVSSG